VESNDALQSEKPSTWVQRFAPLIRTGGDVLDLACGGGRHARYLASLGYTVDAVDRDQISLRALARVADVRPLTADVEGAPWPYDQRVWDGIVVTRYLYRPLFATLKASLRDGGVLIYETFMVGNERLGRPSNADFLLHPNELLTAFGKDLAVVAFEQGEVALPKPAVLQRLCAVRTSDPSQISLPEFVPPAA
jgi:SAM-dependent methyltransferase